MRQEEPIAFTRVRSYGMLLLALHDSRLGFAMNEEHDSTKGQRSLFRFSLRTLMLAVLVVAVYLGGRYGHLSTSAPDLSGQWQAALPAGFSRPIAQRLNHEPRLTRYVPACEV